MFKKFVAGLALFSFILLGASFAAVENIKVSGDINSEAIVRDLGLGEATFDNDHDLFISQIRLRFDADLTEGVAGILQFISERGWGEDNSADVNNADDVEVNLAYVELKEFFTEPLTLIIGKQELRYGNGLIVGNPDTSQGKISGTSIPTGLPTIVQDLSLNKSFDAIRAILDLSPWTIDFVLAQVDEGTTSTTSDRRDDEMLFGINAAYSMGDKGEVSEIYFFGADNTPQSTSSDAEDKVYVVGGRTFFHLSESFSLGLENALQFGDYIATAGTDHDKRRAWAGQFISQYRFNNDYDAKVNLTYTYTSGDDPNSEETYEAWDSMWEDQSPAELFNVLLSNSNRKVLTLSGTIMPREDLTLGLNYARGWLVKRFSGAAIQNTIGPVAGNVYYIDDQEKHLGDEVDGYAVYDYSEDVQLKFSVAWMKPGTVFNERNENNAYSVRAGVNVDF